MVGLQQEQRCVPGGVECKREEGWTYNQPDAELSVADLKRWREMDE